MDRSAPEVLAKDGTPGMREYAGPPGGDMFDLGISCELLDSIPKQDLAEYRAYHGEIFVGRVNEIPDSANRPVIAGVNPERVFSYYVTVERSLTGDASGTIGIVVMRYPGFEPCDHAGPGARQPGGRYLFFAGKDRFFEEYLVTAGTGAVLLANEMQEADLVRRFERRLIPTAEAWERRQIASATARADAEPALMATPAAAEASSQTQTGSRADWQRNRQREDSQRIGKRSEFQGPLSDIDDVVIDGRTRIDRRRPAQLNAERAYHGNIFIARVDAVIEIQAKEHAAGTPTSYTEPVDSYLVTMEQTWVGDAAGQVKIAYRDANAIFPEGMEGGDLQVGQRYLFFAGANWQGQGYLVTAGLDVIRLDNPTQEAALHTGYHDRWIPTAEAYERSQIARASATADAAHIDFPD